MGVLALEMSVQLWTKGTSSQPLGLTRLMLQIITICIFGKFLIHVTADLVHWGVQAVSRKVDYGFGVRAVF